MNTEYLRVLDERRWEFLEKLDKELFVWPWLKVTDTWTVDDYKLTPASLGFVSPAYEGADVYRVVDNKQEFFAIVAAIQGMDIYLDRTSGLGSGTEQTFVFRPRTRMPLDAAEVLGMMSRVDDRGPVRRVSLAEERSYMLNEDQEQSQGWAAVYVSDPPSTVFPGPKGGMVVTMTPLIAAVPLKPKTDYRFFYAYFKQGIYSGRSPITSFTTPASPAAGDGLQVETDEFFEDERGWRRFACVSVANGRWEHFGQPISDTTSQATFYYTESYEPRIPWLDPSPAEYVRFYPRQPSYVLVDAPYVSTAADNLRIQYEVRYKLRPVKLGNDEDLPMMPEQFHQLLVHLTCQRIAAKREDTSIEKFHRTEAERYMKLMSRRHLAHNDLAYQFREWTDPLGDSPFSRPSIRKLN
jgi:hypothetical protein